MGFPEIRMRERRKDESIRKKYRQTPELSVKDLIMPIFVKEGIFVRKEIKSMPGIYQYPLKDIPAQAKKIYHAGIPAVILFGIAKHKDDLGAAAYDEKGIVQQAIRAIKSRAPGLAVIADVCMCEYTSHGHCGIIKRQKAENEGRCMKDEGRKESSVVSRQSSLVPLCYDIDNDATIEILAKIAVSYAKAGADTVAPSAMMDGQVKAIKEALMKNNYSKIKIMAYSAKYASGFYEPFREAAESPPQFGDRKTYQMDYHNSDEAVLEAKLDIEEGADMVMVKPALGYEDIIYRIKQELKFPLACFSVSGEYSMIKAFSRYSKKINGSTSLTIDTESSRSAKNRVSSINIEKNLVLEALTGFKRAGADSIITYYALEAAGWLKNKR